MKQCPTCDSKYPDDFIYCDACSIQIMEWYQSKNVEELDAFNTYKVPLIDNDIVKEIHYYGISNKKLQKKYPKECQIYSEAQAEIQKIRQECNSKSVLTTLKATPHITVLNCC